MKFSELIEQLNMAGMITDVQITQDCEVDDLSLTDREFRDFNDHTVYFSMMDRIGPATQFPQNLLYFGQVPETRTKYLVNSAQITTASMATVFRFVKSHLDQVPQAQTQYTNLMSSLMAGTNLNTVLTEAFSYTGNLFVAIDLTGKILSHSTPFYVDYSLWMNSVQQGYCDEILMDYIESRRRHLNAPKGPQPFSLYCRHLDMYILVTRILHEGETLGYFFALSRSPHFDNMTMKVMPLFAQRAKEKILRLKNASNRNNILQTSILMDALAGATPAETGLRTKVGGLKFDQYMRVLTIKSIYNRTSEFYSQALLPELEEILPKQVVFPYRTALICLFNTDQNGTIPEDMEASLTDFCKKHNAIIGVSNVFSQISEFAEHADQARKAMSFYSRIENTSPFFYYLDYVLYIMLDCIQDDKLLGECCHPALQRLAQYDEKKGTELFNTLKIYTECGFSKTRTAQVMFIHRNTINYRIQQIEKLCGIDLSNENLLFVLQMSFKMDGYSKKRFVNEP